MTSNTVGRRDRPGDRQGCEDHPPIHRPWPGPAGLRAATAGGAPPRSVQGVSGAKLDALGDLLKGNRDELAGDWTFAGSRHFIGERPDLSRHPWLIRLLAAVGERNAANARDAVGAGQAASAATAAQ